MEDQFSPKPSEIGDGLAIFKDVFRRADKNDDGALSLSEFKTFFSDGILSLEDLEKLFNDIDTHNTTNIDIEELCDYFQKQLGPFSPIFAGLEKMNCAVQNVLLETSKKYPASSFFEKFTTRFLMQEVVSQLGSLQYHVDTALEKIDEDENSKRTTVPYVEQKIQSPKKTKTRRKRHDFQHQLSTEGSVVMCRQIDRLADLVTKLETKVKFNVVEEEINPRENKTVTIVRRKFTIHTEKQNEFRKSLRSYINETGCVKGCLEVAVRVFTNSDVFVLYEIWANKDDLNSHYISSDSKTFLRHNIDYLQKPEEYSQMPIPAVWINRESSDTEDDNMNNI